MERRTFQRPAALAVAAIIGLLVLPLPSKGEVSCHPNIFGGQGSIAVKLGGNGQKLEFAHEPAPPPKQTSMPQPGRDLSIAVDGSDDGAARDAIGRLDDLGDRLDAFLEGQR